MIDNQKNPLISIIIPVYNTKEGLLKRCIQSIDNQTYSNIELIIVDDGSKNAETISILNKLQNKEKTSIIKQDNQGVSSARNTGLSKAKGEYIIFIDADDYISNKYVENLLNKSIKNNVSVVLPKVVDIRDGSIINTTQLEEKIYNLSKDTTPFIEHDPLFSSRSILFASNLAKKELFDTNMRYGEDTHYTIRVLKKNNFTVSNDAIYYYVKNPDSVCANYSAAIPYIQGMFKMYSTAASLYPKEKDKIMQLLWNKIDRAAIKLFLSGITIDKYKQTMSVIYSDCISKIGTMQKNVKLPRKIKNYVLIKKLFFIHYILICLSNKSKIQ